MALQPGAAAPSFQLPSTEGRELSLADFAGKKVVIFFYPRDSTPGCTQEACDFRDAEAALQAAGAVVLGISKDSLASHAKFRANHELGFPLLTDEGNLVATAYGAFGEKTMYGKKVMGTIRSTFLIDEKGVIERTWSPVKVAGHAEAVLAAVRGE
jgi:thioredoxin-dependent peroxiredoxin